MILRDDMCAAIEGIDAALRDGRIANITPNVVSVQQAEEISPTRAGLERPSPRVDDADVTPHPGRDAALEPAAATA